MDNEKKKVSSVSVKEDLSNVSGLSPVAALIIKLAAAFLSSGKFLKDDLSFRQVDDSEEYFIFGDFSKLIALLRRLIAIAPIGFTATNKLSKDQQTAIGLEGVYVAAYQRMAKKLLKEGVVSLKPLNDHYDRQSVRQELTRFLSLHQAIYRKSDNKYRIFLSFGDEPWHKLSTSSACSADSALIAGLSVVITYKPEPREEMPAMADDSFEDLLDHAYMLSMTSNYPHKVRRRSQNTYLLALAVNVTPQDLYDCRVVTATYDEPLYDLDTDKLHAKQTFSYRGYPLSGGKAEVVSEQSEAITNAIVLEVAYAILDGKKLTDPIRNTCFQKLAGAWKRRFDMTDERLRRTGDKSLMLGSHIRERLGSKTNLSVQDFGSLMPEPLDPIQIALRHLDKGTEPSEEERNETEFYDGSTLMSVGEINFK